MRYVGIDLGASGGIVILDDRLDVVSITDMQTLKQSYTPRHGADDIKGAEFNIMDTEFVDNVLDGAGVMALDSYAFGAGVTTFDSYVFVEATFPVPGKSASSMWTLGGYFLQAIQYLRSKGLQHGYAKENEWKKFFGIKNLKKLGPDGKKPNVKKAVFEYVTKFYDKKLFQGPRGGLFDGRSDAMAIALYGYAVANNITIDKLEAELAARKHGADK